ncbi:MAG: sensor domain-containing protein [Gammaproteobacteria bacterium]|nr:sensor domain-containing protein [Gammaproteobacteria bacterium]
MTRPAPRSIEEYLRQLRTALEGEDPALIQDALYDAEEYLRAEVAAHPDRGEADVLELIANTYGAPEEVAAAYRDTEVKVKAALAPPTPPAARSGWRRFFAVYSDPRAYTSLFFMLLALATGIVYFTVTVTGLSLSLGLAILIIGVPFFLAFIGITRAMALAEGRLIEAVTGERMPRRPPHPGAKASLWTRIAGMLTDWRTWSTLVYFLLMLPLGIIYFTVAVTGLSVGVACVTAPIAVAMQRLGWIGSGWIDSAWQGEGLHAEPAWLAGFWGLLLLFILGVALVTLLMHLARGIGRLHARLAKALLVAG